MTTSDPILSAIDALNAGDRAAATRLLEKGLETAGNTPARFTQIAKLAGHIGEIDLSLEAARRAGLHEPVNLGAFLAYCGALASAGRSEEALTQVERLPPAAARLPAVLHFKGTVASELGDFDRAEGMFRAAVEADPGSSQSWFALAMLRTFTADDPALASMEQLAATGAGLDGFHRAQLHYALGKAYDDAGDLQRSFAHYDEGAALRGPLEPYPRAEAERFADATIRDLTSASLKRLKDSAFREQRAMFVTGFPRSGTTLVEQILASHSQVADGAETGLFRAALLPLARPDFEHALAYNRRGGRDPWGAIAADYHRMLAMRFRGPGQVVDKTLGHSALMGLLLHSMPEARVVWLRRDPGDVALSAYRSFFATSVPWSWRWSDIAHHMMVEDRLRAHWAAEFPERILLVDYESLAREPEPSIRRILSHLGLPEEPGVFTPHKTSRGVRTASVQQVRSPISGGAIGRAARYAPHMQAFFDLYRR